MPEPIMLTVLRTLRYVSMRGTDLLNVEVYRRRIAIAALTFLSEAEHFAKLDNISCVALIFFMVVEQAARQEGVLPSSWTRTWCVDGARGADGGDGGGI